MELIKPNLTFKKDIHTTYAVTYPYAPVELYVYFIYDNNIKTNIYFSTMSECIDYIESVNKGYTEHIYSEYCIDDSILKAKYIIGLSKYLENKNKKWYNIF